VVAISHKFWTVLRPPLCLLQSSFLVLYSLSCRGLTLQAVWSEQFAQYSPVSPAAKKLELFEGWRSIA